MAELETKRFREDPLSSSSPAPAVVVVGLLIGFLHTLSLTLLTLLSPLSFLLLSRLTNYPHLLNSSSSSLYTSLLLLHFLVPLTSLLALFHAFTGRRCLPTPAPVPLAWTFLCVFQLCVGFGIEATITAGPVEPDIVAGAGLGIWVRRAVFVVGLYETTVFWSSLVVRKVVDDTIFGVQTEEGRVERAVVGLAFGLLWVRLLREEVEMGLVAGMGQVGWWGVAWRVVRDVTVTVGMVRMAKGFVWVSGLAFVQFVGGDDADSCGDEMV